MLQSLLVLLSHVDRRSGRSLVTSGWIAERLQLDLTEARRAVARLKQADLARRGADRRTDEDYFLVNPYPRFCWWPQLPEAAVASV